MLGTVIKEIYLRKVQLKAWARAGEKICHDLFGNGGFWKYRGIFRVCQNPRKHTVPATTLQRPRIYEDFSLVHAGIASYTLYFWQLVETLALLSSHR